MSSAILAASNRTQGQNIPVTTLFTRKELVGKGAYGGVYKGVHNESGTVVALKVIDMDTPDDDISEIQKEVALLSELRDAARHNITLYHGCYLHGHELWIAMDFASGGSIRTLMKSGPIEEKYAALIVREVLVALSFLHRQDIIHRDVKAANILLTQTGKILLCDFGVAAHLQANSKRSTFTGTPLWMAPEVITDGKMYDTKADIWSLGITLYEIATGNPPYFGMEPLRACALIPKSQPPKLEGGVWSNPMREFLANCLQVDPALRPTADELSRSKWPKSASKLPMALLRELIVRYVAWIQAGGQRTSIVGTGAGMEDLVQREDTFELGRDEDGWDFDVEEEDFGMQLGLGRTEGLGDEPARTLDEKAAASSPNRLARTPSSASSTKPRTPTPPRLITINLPSGLSSINTVKATISIPSFDEMDDMSSSAAAGWGGSGGGGGAGWGGAGWAGTGFGGGGGGGVGDGYSTAFGAADDLMSPATVRSNPFAAWGNSSGSQPKFGAGGAQGFMPPSPRFGGEGSGDTSWGGGSGTGTGTNSSTPTEAHFPAAELVLPSLSSPSSSAPYPSVTSSPSLPSIPAAAASFPLSPPSTVSDPNRPFPASRRRADTAPSGHGAPAPYPPLGAGIPARGNPPATMAYPPLGPGLPRRQDTAVTTTATSSSPMAGIAAPSVGDRAGGAGHSANPSVSSVSGTASGSGSGSGSGFSFAGSAGPGSSNYSTAASTPTETTFVNRPFGGGGAAGGGKTFQFGGVAAARERAASSAAAMAGEGIGKPFRVPGGGMELGGGSAGGGRPRTGSDSGRRQGLKILTSDAPVPPPSSSSVPSPSIPSPPHVRQTSHTPDHSSGLGYTSQTSYPFPGPPIPSQPSSSSSTGSGFGSVQMQRTDSQTSPKTLHRSHASLERAAPPTSPPSSSSSALPRHLRSASSVSISSSTFSTALSHSPAPSISIPLPLEGEEREEDEGHEEDEKEDLGATRTPLASSTAPQAPHPRPSATTRGFPFPPAGDGLARTGTSSPSSSAAPPPAAPPHSARPPAPLGPGLRPLEYGRLGTRAAVQAELGTTLEELARWLELVGDGLDRVLAGEVDVGVGVGLEEAREGRRVEVGA
ncbi:SPOSA6832_02819, partial [Sporobolomyces salmonicolor]